ncbi:MAG: hypothetical protein V9H26_25615 [Verrucomicrobiota bacterium]
MTADLTDRHGFKEESARIRLIRANPRFDLLCSSFMARILFTVTPAAGHLHPTIPIALALQARWP